MLREQCPACFAACGLRDVVGLCLVRKCDHPMHVHSLILSTARRQAPAHARRGSPSNYKLQAAKHNYTSYKRQPTRVPHLQQTRIPRLHQASAHGRGLGRTIASQCNTTNTSQRGHSNEVATSRGQMAMQTKETHSTRDRAKHETELQAAPTITGQAATQPLDAIRSHPRVAEEPRPPALNHCT